MTDVLTTAQAAFVLGKQIDDFQRTVDKSPVKPRVVSRGGRRVRQFRLADLVFFHAYSELKRDLTPKSQEALYKAMRKLPAEPESNEVFFGNHAYRIDAHLKAVKSGLEELKALADEIVVDGKETYIRGTRIEPHRIAALYDGGMAVDEILRDYPSLSQRQVLAAKAYSDANPKRGRPYPGLTAKAALRQADLSALDTAD